MSNANLEKSTENFNELKDEEIVKLAKSGEEAALINIKTL